MSYSIVFTKKFTNGILEGLNSSPQFLDWPTPESRLNWIKGVRANQKKGSLNWVFEGDTFYFTNFSREKAIEDYKTWARV